MMPRVSRVGSMGFPCGSWFIVFIILFLCWFFQGWVCLCIVGSLFWCLLKCFYTFKI